ncbi:MAG TPA: hypothetical protein VJ227_03505 [Patescibacteria group bacterium]|nr:hypothetical protein [Patescibacteria group bacterium]
MITRSPILFLIFNRPAETKTVFAEIRKARPTHLFIAADGPRSGVSGEKEKCEAVRKITENIDWRCDVKRLYRKNNLGCKRAISGALGWFFQNVKEGIILEDDCLPDKSFFRYCEELLIKYRNNKNIGVIGGNNFSRNPKLPDSYYFSLYPQMWGWATWRRVWKNYDIAMKKWPRLGGNNWLNGLFPVSAQATYWWSIFDSTFRGKVDTWDYQWVFSSFINGYLNITPNVNLVRNIGFGDQATHLRKTRLEYSRKTNRMMFPMRHPDRVVRNLNADKLEAKYLYNYVSPFVRLKWLFTRGFLAFKKAMD